MGEIRQILKKKKKILFVFKGYTCRFKSEAFASIASICATAMPSCGIVAHNSFFFFTKLVEFQLLTVDGPLSNIYFLLSLPIW